MKILVCGGRDYTDRARVFDVLDQLWGKHRDFGILIHGGATGADRLAGMWAREKGVQEVVCAANWSKHGKAGGPIRNECMMELNPDLVVAFPGGKGTAGMVALAKKACVPVYLIDSEDGEPKLLEKLP